MGASEAGPETGPRRWEWRYAKASVGDRRAARIAG